jgi:hypothetical protein
MKLPGITLQGYRRIAQAIESPAMPVENPEEHLPDTLFHTTSQEGARGIIEDKTLKAREDGFISFSEVPVAGGDLEGNDVVLEVKRPNNVMPVEYNQEWFDKYPEHAAYIAGEDWEDQLDEEGKTIGMFKAFMKKEPEKEWISKEMGIDVLIDIVDIQELEERDMISEFYSQNPQNHDIMPYDSNRGSYTCPECGATFETEKGLKVHQSRSHKKSY